MCVCMVPGSCKVQAPRRFDVFTIATPNLSLFLALLPHLTLRPLPIEADKGGGQGMSLADYLQHVETDRGPVRKPWEAGLVKLKKVGWTRRGREACITFWYSPCCEFSYVLIFFVPSFFRTSDGLTD